MRLEMDLEALVRGSSQRHAGRTQAEGDVTDAVLKLPLSDIDEDPTQPRVEFDDGPLRELADTIAERGVRQPVSVRPHPTDPGRWMLNFGARRLRASKLAGLTEIPAFVDRTADSFDQVIENEQREGLTALELALFIERQTKAGIGRAEIARRIGKSKTFITMASALVDAPDWLMLLYRSGRCRGLWELYALRRTHEVAPDRVRQLVDSGEPITRGHLESLSRSAGEGRGAVADGSDSSSQQARAAASPPADEADEPASSRPTAPFKECGDEAPPAVPSRPQLWADLQGARVQVLLSRTPPQQGEVVVEMPGSAGIRSVRADLLTGLTLLCPPGAPLAGC